MYFASSSASVLKWLVQALRVKLMLNAVCIFRHTRIYVASYVAMYALCTAVWIDPECGGITHCGEAWERETAGDKVNDIALTMLHFL